MDKGLSGALLMATMVESNRRGKQHFLHKIVGYLIDYIGGISIQRSPRIARQPVIARVRASNVKQCQLKRLVKFALYYSHTSIVFIRVRHMVIYVKPQGREDSLAEMSPNCPRLAR